MLIQVYEIVVATTNDKYKVSIKVVMFYLSIKEIHLKYIKRGRISLHKTISKGKEYFRSKIYFRNSDDVGAVFHLYEIENLHMVDKHKRKNKGKGYINLHTEINLD